MMKQLAAVVLAALMLGVSSVPQTQVVTAQILDYEKGYLFFTTGDGFHVSPNAVIVNGPPATREYARVTFDATGTITRIEVSKAKLPPEGDLAAIHHFAIALSPAQPNPDLAAPQTGNLCSKTIGGKLVAISITVQVPATTALADTVYMTSDQSGWNPQAYRLDRIDALHYRALLRLYSGTVMHVLFDRGSTQTMQVQENGIEQQPYVLCIGDEDAQAFTRTVYRWADEQLTGMPAVPQSLPTPYNPAPFPNLPSPPGPARTPLPH
jgi:hypothetical protein